jgi:hypothetical protein
MKVYLVPAGGGRHELYCEITPAANQDVETASAGDAGARTIAARARASAQRTWRRVVDTFRRMVDEGDAHRYGQPIEGAESQGRLRRLITRKVAEAVAEQRLLWHLRQETVIDLVHPDTMSDGEAIRLARGLIGADLSKHLRWCVIDGILVLITGPLFFFVPGPNVISWYFTFRGVGHFFAYRGASQGLTTARWVGVPSGELTALGAALALEGDTRARRIDEIASALGLERLPLFIEKVA